MPGLAVCPWDGQSQASLPVLNLGHSLTPVPLAGQELGIQLALGKPGCGTESTLLPGWLWDLTESTWRQQQQQSSPSLPHTEHSSAAQEVQPLSYGAELLQAASNLIY